MAIISLYSVKGAPGVSTTALGLATHWPRHAVLIGADTYGDSLPAGYLKGAISHERGLTSLQIDRYENPRSWNLADHLVDLPRIGDLSGTTRALIGVTDSGAAASFATIWADLVTALGTLEHSGVDAIVDLGRLSLTQHDPRQPLIAGSTLRIMVTGSSLPDIVTSVKFRLNPASPISSVQGGGVTTDAALITAPGEPYGVREISRLLQLPVIGTVPQESASAAVYSAGEKPGRKHSSGSLVRAYRSAASTLRSVLDSNDRILTGEITP